MKNSLCALCMACTLWVHAQVTHKPLSLKDMLSMTTCVTDCGVCLTSGVAGAWAGHNADDIAETVLLNLLRGDVPRLGRCANIVTGEDGALPRCKPFK